MLFINIDRNGKTTKTEDGSNFKWSKIDVDALLKESEKNLMKAWVKRED